MPVQDIPLDQIKDNPYQDRGAYIDIEALGRSIATQGLQQIPVARRNGSGYELKFGHRRKRAFEWLSKHWKQENLPARYNAYTVMPLDVEEIDDHAMFDHMVVENVHRDDLKVTEKARLLRRYKEIHPTATSGEIGLVFNMNAATVRGMDMYLDLYPELQAALDDGTITQGTARVFHSMQKIATKKDVLKTLEAVIKNEDGELPEAVIESAIHHLDNTVEMWDEGFERGKPRGGRHGWLLDMKNFPNHLLPPVTEEQSGTLEESQRAHLSDPPACNACPFYTKVRGSHFCGVKPCYQRKQVAWERLAVEQASKQTKIPVYTQEDGAYRVLDYGDISRKLFEKKHKGLRLAPKSMIGAYVWRSFSKLNDDLVAVVATGADLLGKIARETGTGGRARGGKKSEKEKAEMRAMKIYRVKRRELMWEYTAAAQSLFADASLETLKKINRWEHILMDDSIPEEYDHPQTGSIAEQLAFQRRALVWRLIMSLSPNHHRADLTGTLDKFVKLTGVTAPKSLVKRAQDWDAEIKSAASVSTATKKGKA